MAVGWEIYGVGDTRIFLLVAGGLYAPDRQTRPSGAQTVPPSGAASLLVATKNQLTFQRENRILLSGMKFYVYESMPPKVPPAVQSRSVVTRPEGSAPKF